MKCTVCREDVKELDIQTKSHLMITKSIKGGHIHVHGDLAARENCKEMLEQAAEEIGVSIIGSQAKAVPTEVVFHNRQRIGDMLMFTCAIRDFKAAFPNVRVGVVSTAMHIWDHNPNVDRSLIPNEQNTVKIGPSWLTNASNRIDWHFANAFRISIEQALKVHIPQGESRPDIYLTQEEYDAPSLFDFPYWVISTNGEKGWGCKMYPHTKWQEFVDQNPDIHFVQIGTAEDNAPRLRGKNVIDYVGKTQSKETGIRDLFKLFLNAEGSIGLVSFHMHLSGALYKPAIVVAGAREPVRFTRYEGHAYLSTDGMLPCATKACWHCDIKACTNPVERKNHEGASEIVPKCVDMIAPEDLTRALRNYYTGGRLIADKPSVKPKLKNIVKTPPRSISIPTPEGPIAVMTEDNQKYGMPFGGGSITERDWAFMKGVIEKYQVKSVLEFGAGLSTLLLNDTCKRVLTFETSQGWIDKIHDFKPKADVRSWDGKTEPVINCDLPETFDFAFVDGPAGDIGREVSTKTAAQLASVVIVHDAGREHARLYQDKYLKPLFDGPFKGGHRCHLWVRKDTLAPEMQQRGIQTQMEAIQERGVQHEKETKGPQETDVLKSVKTVKIVSTARGWGGCARSVTTIMRYLLNAGHKVEFIPFRNSVTSAEFKAMLAGDLKDVKVTCNYETLKEGADVLFVYADDYIWEFGRTELEEAFSNVGADRKIMMLNYRRGKVGEIPWTKNWDKYMFLNSTQEKEFLKIHPYFYGNKKAWVKTKVLPPCTDLDPFFKISINYEQVLHLVRHSSQGDTKFAKDFDDEVAKVQAVSDLVKMSFLPGPSFVSASDRIKKFPRTDKPTMIAEFLAEGNCFWYSLPLGYMDMGPRVILEAMAAGLPIIADNWGGAVDRVTPECGWLCGNKEEHVRTIENIVAHANPAMLRAKGQAARERAYAVFRPEAWIKEILE